jgi:peptidyl-prolyl cis-trans isomerase D
MASLLTPKKPAGKQSNNDASGQPKRGIKNPFIYAGTVVVLVIVVVAFVFVPSVGGAGGGGSTTLEFGRYAGKSIAYAQGTYFARQVQDLNDRLRQQGLTEQNFQLFAYQVWRGAFERTVVRMAILDEVKKAGGYITEARLDERVTEQPNFQENGKFSPRRYREATLAEKLSIRDTIREESLTSQFYSDVYSATPSSKETAFIADLAKQTRTIEYAAFPLSAFPDSEVAAWAKTDSNLFRRIKLSRITLTSSEADALKVLKQVKDNSVAFDEAAKSHSKDSFAEKGGDAGLKYFHEISADLNKKEDAEKIITLKKGELSPVFKTVASSWVFFRADEAMAQADFSDAAVLKDVKDYMNRFEKGKMEDWSIAKAKAFAATATGDFAAACRKAGMTPKTAGPFPLNYGDFSVAYNGQSIPVFKQIAATDAPELASASRNEKFLTAAFGPPPGTLSEPILLGDSVLVLKVKAEGTAAADEIGMINSVYSYFVQQKTSAEVQENILKSPALKDNFSPVFFKYFAPSQK